MLSDIGFNPRGQRWALLHPPPPINKQLFSCLFLSSFTLLAKCRRGKKNKKLIAYLFEAKGRTAAFATQFSATALLSHLLLLFLLLLQCIRGRWITVHLVCCSSWYASPLSNQIKPTCDQPMDNTNMQTVYIWEDLPFPSLPELVLKPLTVPRFRALGVMRRICGSGMAVAFNSTIKASDVVVELNPLSLTPGSLLLTQTFVSFWQVITLSCW